MSEKNLTQFQLCEEIGISVSSLKRLKGTISVADNHIHDINIINLVENYIDKNYCKSDNNMYVENKEMQKDIIDMGRKIQKLNDSNRILRKHTRNINRSETISESLFVELLDRIAEYRYSDDGNIRYNSNLYDSKNSMIIQLSDIHIGHKVSLRNNIFNYNVAETRLNKFFDKALDIVENHKINDIHIVLTGDLINLDTRLDQLLTSESTRAESLIKAFDLLEKNIRKIIENTDAKISLSGVVGNESRLKGHENFSSVDAVAIDSFDYILFQMLKRRFYRDIEFINDCEFINDVITVNNKNIAITHGNYFKTLKEDEMQSFKMNLYEQTNKKVDYVIFGHIHDTLIKNTFARSGSLVGANAYATNQLLISNSVPSQNLHIVSEDGIYTLAIKLD